jgi:hypothetical protein
VQGRVEQLHPGDVRGVADDVAEAPVGRRRREASDRERLADRGQEPQPPVDVGAAPEVDLLGDDPGRVGGLAPGLEQSLVDVVPGHQLERLGRGRFGLRLEGGGRRLVEQRLDPPGDHVISHALDGARPLWHNRAIPRGRER